MFNYVHHTQEVVGVNSFWSEESDTVLTLKGPLTHSLTHTQSHYDRSD